MKSILFFLVLSLSYDVEVRENETFNVAVDDVMLNIPVERGAKGDRKDVTLNSPSFFSKDDCEQFAALAAKEIAASRSINGSNQFLGYALVGPYHAFAVTARCEGK